MYVCMYINKLCIHTCIYTLYVHTSMKQEEEDLDEEEEGEDDTSAYRYALCIDH